ncbi:hypothetical protein Trydic_g23630 [Trypoxylus dichotomus]
MDSVPYHSVKVEKIPTTASKSDAVIDWIIPNGIAVDNSLLNVGLLELAKNYLNHNPIPYIINEMVAESGCTILPPYHCNLNLVEMVWARVKEYLTN